MNKVVVGNETDNPQRIKLGTIIVIHDERGETPQMVVRSCSPRNAEERVAHVILVDLASGNLWSSKYMLASDTRSIESEFVTRGQVEEYINQYGGDRKWSVVNAANVTLEASPED